jgi:plasmid stabilization system protein ParE
LAATLAAPSAAQSFESLASGTVRVEYVARQRTLAREVMDAARKPIQLPGMGRRGVPDSTTIVLAPSEAAFQRATGGDVPEWAGGVAIPEASRIVLPEYPGARVRDDDQGTILRHEVAHLLLHRSVPGIVPRWFDEGYAEVASGGWDVEGAWQLRVAFVSGALPPLDSLTLDWPTRESDARTAYLLSATAVDYLRRRGGDDGMRLLFANWRAESDFEKALRLTFGITLGQFEDEWRKDVSTRYGWLAMLSNLALVWLVATALVLAAWIPRRRRNRLKLARMEAEEHMLPPASVHGPTADYPLPDLPDDE